MSDTLKIKTKNLWVPGVGVLLIAALIYWLILSNLPITFYLTISWILILLFLLWFGNKFISKFLNKKIPWIKYVTFRFFLQLGLSIIYYLLCLNGSYLLFKNLFTVDPPTSSQLLSMNIYGAFMILPVFSIYFGVHFLKTWRKSEIEAEKFQKESIKSQLEALKNHLDPHFLFNNLNILSSLIDKDKKLSKHYLEKFAEVYRIILQNEVSELITLQKELDFIESYLYLIKIRFQESIIVHMDIPIALKNKMLPPLTIQMLIENSIKHNAITETSPLTINIYIEEGHYLVVRNNLKAKKNHSNRNSSGLENISNRYAYFSEEKIVVQKTDFHFTVKVPLLEIEEI